MTDMLSKVDRAIRHARNEGLNEAKAAIEALRSPTDEMLDEGDCTLPQFDEGYIRMECLKVAWQAMIDKALEGKP